MNYNTPPSPLPSFAVGEIKSDFFEIFSVSSEGKIFYEGKELKTVKEVAAALGELTKSGRLCNSDTVWKDGTK